MQERRHVYIGFIDRPQGQLTLVGLNGRGTGNRYKLGSEELRHIRPDNSHASFWEPGEGRPLASPDGKSAVIEKNGVLIVRDLG
jgi:hypothetical protein